MVIKGDMNAKIGKDAHKNWGSTSRIFCNSVTNERGYRLLEFAKTNKLKIVNTFGPHKKSKYKLGIALEEYIIIKSIIF